ncbi:MAG TPA: GNAT family N-acetyltransferase [Gemmatimonadales bacterium]|nr:GNAT family N-acetyltransferase [Gemmatimonadales bacterium]
MSVEIRQEPPSALTEYARVPIAFEVRERLAIVAPHARLGGLRLVAEPVNPPYWKDYDALLENHPTTWARRYDMAGWGILAAYLGAERTGGAVVVCGAPGVEMLEGRADLAVLWDLRVAPEWQGQGIGAALFRAAEVWAVARGASCLKVETQDINVAACRFYARQGCVLGGFRRFAYFDLPDEAQLLWYKSLPTGANAG